MEEMYEEPRSRSRMGRKGYIKRWLILIAVGVVVGILRTLMEMFVPAQVGGAVSLLFLACYGIPAVVLSVVWTMARASNAGKDEAWGLLVLVPIVNVVAVLAFASMPSREDAQAG